MFLRLFIESSKKVKYRKVLKMALIVCHFDPFFNLRKYINSMILAIKTAQVCTRGLS